MTIRFLSASGQLGGTGVHAAALEEGLGYDPAFIASDCGSTDGGPFFLGSGRAGYSHASVKRDLKLCLAAGRRKRIPVVLGSAGTAGGDMQTDWLRDIAEEAARELGQSFRTAVIYSEQDRDYLKRKLRAGKVRPLDNAPHFDAATIDRSAHIVGMMGTEQLNAALGEGVDLVLAGRCSDSALFAAYPILKGYDAGLAWHAGKVLECGTTACATKSRGIMMGEIAGDRLTITPIGPGLRCTPQSVSAHSLYENPDPYVHHEAGGALDLTAAEITAADDIAVHIRGSRFVKAAEYGVKLEGAELAGYQSIVIFGIRDPYMIAALDPWLAEVEAIVVTRIGEIYPELAGSDYRFTFRVYGRNAVMGRLEPLIDRIPHEVGVVLEITAPSQEMATTIATLARQPLLHHYIPKWKGSITGIAALGSPGYIERGAVYRFNVNHVVLPESPHEMFRTVFTDIGAGGDR